VQDPIDSPPEVVPFALDRQEALIHRPYVTRSWALAPLLMGIRLPALATPLTDGCVGDADPTGKKPDATGCRDKNFNC
jgi:hypothetical protein